MDDHQAWPELQLAAWQDTYATLHMWTQIVGKIRKTLTPLINHWWNVTLVRDLPGPHHVADPVPAAQLRDPVRFHRSQAAILETSEGEVRALDLKPRSVADFYRAFMNTLAALGIDVKIHARPMK